MHIQESGEMYLETILVLSERGGNVSNGTRGGKSYLWNGRK